MQETKNRILGNTSKSKIPDTARPFALVSGAREAYLNFLRNLTPPILLVTILLITGDKLYQKWEPVGTFVLIALASSILLSVWNNTVQLTKKINESYAVVKLNDLPVKGIAELSFVLLFIAMVGYSVVLVMGVISAEEILKNGKAAKQECAPAATTKSKPTP